MEDSLYVPESKDYNTVISKDEKLQYTYFLEYTKAATLLETEFQSIINSFKIISVSSFLVVIGLFLIYEDQKIDNRFIEKFNENYQQIIFDIGIRFLLPFIFVILLKFQGNNTIILWLGKICYFATFLFTTQYYSLLTVKCYSIPYPPIAFIFVLCITVVLAIFGLYSKSSNFLKKTFILITIALLSIVYINFLQQNSTVILFLFGGAAVIDGISVLCPWGSLNILFRVLRTENEKVLDGFVYPLNEEKEIDKKETPLNNSIQDTVEIEITEKNLGCGDILLFSIFIGFISLQNDWALTVASFIAILVGLGITFLCLNIFKRETLPALPIPIFLAITVYFLMNKSGSNLMNEFVMHQLIV